MSEDRERADGGQYASAASPADVLGVFEAVEGPAITSRDVVDVLGVSREVARKRLAELYDQGRIERRKSGRTVLWWRAQGAGGYERAVGIFTQQDAAAMRDERERLRREWGEREDESVSEREDGTGDEHEDPVSGQ